MKIVIPSFDGKLCAHFGHCEYFTFVEANLETKEIVSMDSIVPEGGVSCQSAGWIAEQGVDVVLVGGIGGRPLSVFEEYGILVITGCPELELKTIVEQFLENKLVSAENTCGGGHHSGEGHHSCGGHCGHHNH